MCSFIILLYELCILFKLLIGTLSMNHCLPVVDPMVLFSFGTWGMFTFFILVYW